MRAFPLGLAAIACLSSGADALAVLDVNADQVSDVWQSRFAAQALSPSLDSDGDGFTNLQESILGTDPHDPASRFSSAVVPLAGGGGVRLDWTTLRHKRHRLESSTDLVNWSPLATIPGDGAARSDVVSAAGPRLFVRVRAEDLDSDGDGLSDWEERATGFDPRRVFSEGLGSNPTTPTTNNPRITDFERLRTLLANTSQTVTIAALDPAMAENWPDPGVVVVRRTGRLDPLTVNLALGGSATSGFDYGAPGFLSVTIPFGADEATFSLTPLADALTEGDETITVTLQPGAGYTLGAASVATLTITDAADGRVAEKAAARFLAQATFGRSPAELARVRELGFAGWLDAQFDRPPNLHLPIVQTWQSELADPLSPATDVVTSDHRLEAWWRQTMRDDAGSDPLRQRVAFALSQIFVISDRMSSLADDQRGMTSYKDLLLAHAFGNYRELIEAVTRHPWMGLYLSALRNRKANPALNRFPDENYAREVMQLFSIGLWLLNPDGSLRLSTGADLDPEGLPVPAGQPIPTYGEEQIGVLARIFTGLSYSRRFTSSTNTTEIPTTRFNDGSNIPWHPMRMWDVEHDLAAKTLFLPGHGTLQLPARVASASPDTGAAGDADLAAALDFLAAHPNIGPFVCRQLIQRLVTSNPTPAYLARISAVFANNGAGVRGDLRAVLRAILLDPEARDPFRGADPTHGLVREPYTRFVALARALGAAPGPDAGGRFRGFSGVDADFLQRPLSAPSVFNFYSPFYQPPGPAGALGLVAPELQIVNSVTAIAGPNRFSSALSAGSSTGLTRFNNTSYSDNPDTALNEADYNTRVNETAWLPLASGDPDALVAALDRALCAGTMTPATFRSVARAVRRLEDPGASGLAASEVERRARQRFRVAAHLVAMSADAAVLK